MIIQSENKLIIAYMIVVLCACMYMHITCNRYNKYTNIDEVKIEGIILNKYKESDYNAEYIMKVTNPQKFKNIRIILKTKKNNNIHCNYILCNFFDNLLFQIFPMLFLYLRIEYYYLSLF